jgi:hypothetical protein
VSVFEDDQARVVEKPGCVGVIVVPDVRSCADAGLGASDRSVSGRGVIAHPVDHLKRFARLFIQQTKAGRPSEQHEIVDVGPAFRIGLTILVKFLSTWLILGTDLTISPRSAHASRGRTIPARRERRPARRVVWPQLQSPSSFRRERLSRRRDGVLIRPEAAVRALRAVRRRRAAELE